MHRVVQTARYTLGVLGSSLYPLEPEEITVSSELAVIASLGLIRVVLTEELPTATVVTVEQRFIAEGSLIDVPVVALTTLRESGILGPVATALAARLLHRAAEQG